MARRLPATVGTRGAATRFLALAVLLSGIAALCQERAAHEGLSERIRSLNQAMTASKISRPDLLRTVHERARLLSELIASHPAEAISLALPRAQAARLAASLPEAANQIETQGEWEGAAAVYVDDDFARKTSRTRVWIEAGGEEVEVHLDANQPAPASGEHLNLRGVRLGRHIAATAVSAAAAPATASACSTTGEQKIAILMMQFPGIPFPTSVVTPSELHDIYFSTTQISLDGYWREASYGKTSASGEVFGPFTLDQYYDFQAQQAEGEAAAIRAADSSVDFTVYNHIVFIWPAPNVTGWGGRGTVGCLTLNSPSKGQFMGTVAIEGIGTRQPYANMVEITCHEHGHNLGLNHATSLDFAPLALGPPGATGVYTEYGDPFSVMGGGEGSGGTMPAQYNAPHKSFLGWLLAGSDVQNVEATGSFTLQPYENSTGLRAIRVRRGPGSDKWLWLEYRQPIGYDAGFPASANVFSGALIHYEDPELTQYQFHSLLLDFTPDTPHVFLDAALAAGQTWSDPVSSLSLSVASAGASGLTVDVAYGTPCVTLSPASRNHGAGVDTGTITVSAPAGCTWTAAANSDWITITAGQSGTGPGTVTYAVTANTGTAARTGVIFVGWQSFTVTQATSFVKQPPTVDAFAPASGTGLSQTFTYTVSDPNGAAALRNFFVWFHPTDSGTGCLFLITLDTRQVGFPIDGTASFSQFPAGSHFALQNSFCGVDVSRTSVTASGNSMTVSVPIVFSAKLQGDLVHVVTVTDSAGEEPSFTLGAWTVPNTPCPYSLVPASASVSQNATAGTVSVATNPGCPWLASISDFWIKVQSDVRGTGSGTVAYTIDADGPISRTGAITIAGQAFPISQSATPGTSPSIALGGVINAASLAPGLAPATWTSIKGANLAQSTRIWQASDFSGNLLPTQLDGVSVWLNGNPGYVYYISPTQINVLTPDSSTTGQVQVQVANSQGTSNTVTAGEVAFAPALFPFSPKYPAATHANGVLVGPVGLIPGANFAPAKPGETISLYGTGFGPGNPPPPAAEVVTVAAPLLNTVTVMIGGRPAQVPFAGLAFSGEDQINVTLPADLPDGDALLSATVGGASTQAGMFIFVQH